MSSIINSFHSWYIVLIVTTNILLLVFIIYSIILINILYSFILYNLYLICFLFVLNIQHNYHHSNTLHFISLYLSSYSSRPIFQVNILLLKSNTLYLIHYWFFRSFFSTIQTLIYKMILVSTLVYTYRLYAYTSY